MALQLLFNNFKEARAELMHSLRKRGIAKKLIAVIRAPKQTSSDLTQSRTENLIGILVRYRWMC